MVSDFANPTYLKSDVIYRYPLVLIIFYQFCFNFLKGELEAFVYGEEEVSISICKDTGDWRLSFRSKKDPTKTFLMLCKLVSIGKLKF